RNSSAASDVYKRQVVDRPPARWGLAPRGASVEIGTPSFDFDLDAKEQVWSDDAARLYAQACAAQWDPEKAIDWRSSADLPGEIEQAVVQIMTYLIENETAALVVPARFLGRIHPHFREVQQLLAIQVADEARHIEVFTRRALLLGDSLGLSTAGGQESLKTLLDEPDFAIASFLLSVLGEGSFLSLLHFLDENAPDPVTRQVCRLAGQDEARHVAFGLSHLRRHLEIDPSLRARLAASVDRRHRALQHSAGLNEEVFDGLVLLAAGSWEPDRIAHGHEQVAALQHDMDEGRRARLARLGFTQGEAEALSSLHTKNFM
ncbi:MAG: ferritin-like domain-containing protein, partial [Candidatus Eisenbacteria bacterium]|nr:ferritin-like domain-containing protein [Candidatus Eisenbacteria bacterium]